MLSNSLGTPAILSSVGARILLDMKEAGEKGLNEGMGSNVSRETISGMEFTLAQRSVRESVTSAGTAYENDAGAFERLETVEA